MDAKTYLTLRDRMTKNCSIDCGSCPLNEESPLTCTDLEHGYPEKAIAIVQKWAEEHPEDESEKNEDTETDPDGEADEALDNRTIRIENHGTLTINL